MSKSEANWKVVTDPYVNQDGDQVATIQAGELAFDVMFPGAMHIGNIVNMIVGVSVKSCG